MYRAALFDQDVMVTFDMVYYPSGRLKQRREDLLMTWMNYHSLAYASLILPVRVIGALHGEEEDYPPPDLAAGALSIIGKISS